MSNNLTLNLQSIAEALPDVVNQRLNDAAYVVENAAKDNARVRTGAMRASIHHTDPANNKVVIGSPVEYAPIEEERTRFFSRAFNENIQEVRNCFTGLLEEGIE